MAAVTVPAVDERIRCDWGNSAPEYVTYHDEEWGTPLHGDDALFERLCLEAFQSGLSWLTILRKRPAFRAAFAGFDIDAVAAYTAEDEARLMADSGIVRNRAKIEATIAGARAWLVIQERGGFSRFLWDFVDGRPIQTNAKARKDVPTETEVSRRISKALKAEGFNFVGPTIVYAFMQAVGVVNDHVEGCAFRNRWDQENR